MSAAGGVTRAVERAVLHRCEALQIFSKNNARWVGKPIEKDEARRFRDAVSASGLTPVVSHGSYLINLAAAPGLLRDKSIDATVDELDRAKMLGLLGVVIHPGVAAAGMTEDAALALAARAIRAAFSRRRRDTTMILLEHTAGQGRSIGYRFEHLATMLEHLDGSPRAGVCLDTCHLLASGYDIVSPSGYAETMATFDRVVGLSRLRIIHGNDSKKPRGSRLDRHEHIGKGFVGLDGFRNVLNDPRLAHLAMVIETHKTPGICDDPKGAREDPLDKANLEVLRRLRR